MLGEIMSAAGNILGGFMNQEAQEDANFANAAMAREQMNFQERMSNSAYQRATEDMQKAGLNPMLAYSQGGASSPVGASAKMEPLTGVGTAIQNAAQTVASIRNVEADTVKKTAEAEAASAQASEIQARTPTYSQQIDLSKAQIREIDARIEKTLADTGLTSVQIDKVGYEIQNIIKSGRLINAQTRESLARAGLSEAQIKEVEPRINYVLAQTKAINADVPKREFFGSIYNSANSVTDSLSNWFSREFNRLNSWRDSYRSKPFRFNPNE